MAGAAGWIVLLPAVPPWSGVRAVSPGDHADARRPPRPAPRRRSAPARSETPVPSSTLPVKSVTSPSGAIAIQASICPAGSPGRAPPSGRAASAGPRRREATVRARRPGSRTPPGARPPTGAAPAARCRRPGRRGSARSRTTPAACRIARRMRRCVPQRQRLPASAPRSSPSSGFGFEARSAAAVMIMPLMQKPHWTAWASMKACCNGWGCAGVPRPSSVVTAADATAETGMPHERTARPSTCTVHAPHWESPQPKRGPRRPSSLRST